MFFAFKNTIIINLPPQHIVDAFSYNALLINSLFAYLFTLFKAFGFCMIVIMSLQFNNHMLTR